MKNETLRKKLKRRKRGPGVRVPVSEHGEMNEDELEFIMAVDMYKRINNRPFPRLTELLDVLKTLGWRKQ